MLPPSPLTIGSRHNLFVPIDNAIGKESVNTILRPMGRRPLGGFCTLNKQDKINAKVEGPAQIDCVGNVQVHNFQNGLRCQVTQGACASGVQQIRGAVR